MPLCSIIRKVWWDETSKPQYIAEIPCNVLLEKSARCDTSGWQTQFEMLTLGTVTVWAETSLWCVRDGDNVYHPFDLQETDEMM